MDRGKRASMREGPLSALFRSTEELDREQAAPAPKPKPARKKPAAAAPSTGRRRI